MAADCRFISTARTIASGWSPARSTSRLRGGNSLDTAHWRTMERPAQTLSFEVNLLASPERVDASRCLGKSLGTSDTHARSTGPGPSRRIFCRRVICPCKKRGERVGKTKRGKGTKIMVLTDGNGLPLAADTASASPHEVTLIEPLLERRVIRRKPRRLIYDAAADSDPLRTRLGRRGIELICPHRRKRTKPPTQDGRKTSAVSPSLEDRAVDQLAPELPSSCHALRISCPHFPRIRAVSLHGRCYKQVLKRPLEHTKQF